MTQRLTPDELAEDLSFLCSILRLGEPLEAIGRIEAHVASLAADLARQKRRLDEMTVERDGFRANWIGGKKQYERERGHTGDHERYGSHWPNDGSNASDIPPDKAAAQAEEIARLRIEAEQADHENECLDASVMEYRHRNEELLAERGRLTVAHEAEVRELCEVNHGLLDGNVRLRAQIDGVKLPAELHAAATADFEQTGFAALTDYGRGLALRVLALGPQIVGPAVPPEERKPYSAPTLTNHGTIADLTADHPDDGRP